MEIKKTAKQIVFYIQNTNDSTNKQFEIIEDMLNNLIKNGN